MSKIKFYPPAEERLNIGSHGLGLLLGLFGLPWLLMTPSAQADWVNWTGKLVFGLSIIILYGASTAYHAAKKPAKRQKLRVLDHAAIYVLIAGTYTPFMLVSLSGPLGTGILLAAWVMAFLGIVLKLKFTGRFGLLSTALYVLMGWAIIFAIKPLSAAMPEAGLAWMIWGGVSYTVGAILYAIKKLPYSHPIFHLFVLMGTTCHFVCVYLYV